MYIHVYFGIKLQISVASIFKVRSPAIAETDSDVNVARASFQKELIAIISDRIVLHVQGKMVIKVFETYINVLKIL